jgi:3-keto-disaccharide hydrolase
MTTHLSPRRALALVIVAAFVWTGSGAVRGQGGRGGGTPVAYDDYTGFTKLWDGATFTNWNGETDVWTIEDGMLHADTTKTPGQHHIHYTGPGAIMRDFDLKVEVKLSATGANGGIQYRSRLLHASHGGSIQDPLGKSLPPTITTMAQALAAGIATPPAPRGAGGAPGGGRGGPAGPNGPTNEPNPWQVSGYQFDMDSDNRYTGMLYEGQGRGIVMSPGLMVELLPDRTTARLGTITETPAALIKPHLGLAGEWQQIEIIARGNTLIHMINGKVISVIVDDNPTFRAYQGILSLQLEGSGQIWYRNVYVKQFDKPMEFPR